MSNQDNHPFRSDKDNTIRKLTDQVDELVKENIRLEEINRGRRRDRFWKFVRAVSVYTGLVALTASAGYGIYIGFQDDVKLGKRCTELCEHVLGKAVISGDETTYGWCGDGSRHCVCTTASRHEVVLGKVSREELNSDLEKLSKRFDFESWRKCVNLGSRVPDIACGTVPRTDK